MRKILEKQQMRKEGRKKENDICFFILSMYVNKFLYTIKAVSAAC